MRTGTRILMVLLGIFGILAGVFLIFLTLGVLSGTALFFASDLEQFVGELPYTALGFAVLFIGVILLAFSTPRGTRKEGGGNIVSYTEIGEIRISFKAVENMVLAASRKVKGIRDVNTRIDSTEQGLLIYMRIKTIPDLPIPALVGELQTVVRDYVHEISGSNVAEVKVLVENIAQEKIQKNLR